MPAPLVRSGPARSRGDPIAPLLGRMATGDEAALLALYRRIAPVLYATCLRILRNTEDANDVTSEAFWRLWTRAARFDPRHSSGMAWILTVTRRLALDRRRSRLRRGRTLERFQRIPEEPADGDDDPLARQRLRDALASLSSADRALLESAYFEGLSGAEIAARDHIPLGTVKSRMRAAMARLRVSFTRGRS